MRALWGSSTLSSTSRCLCAFVNACMHVGLPVCMHACMSGCLLYARWRPVRPPHSHLHAVYNLRAHKHACVAAHHTPNCRSKGHLPCLRSPPPIFLLSLPSIQPASPPSSSYLPPPRVLVLCACAGYLADSRGHIWTHHLRRARNCSYCTDQLWWRTCPRGCMCARVCVCVYVYECVLVGVYVYACYVCMYVCV